MKCAEIASRIALFAVCPLHNAGFLHHYSARHLGFGL